MSKILLKINVPLRFNRNKYKLKWWYINLNNLIQASKNTTFRNQLKQRYSDLIEPKLRHLKPIEGTIKIIYVIHGKDARKFDVGNVGAVLDKFFCDCLVKKGILTDDDHSIIKRVEYVFGGINREDPTADIYILRDEIAEYEGFLRRSKRSP